MTKFLEVDVDRMSYFELKDYIKELGYTPECDFFIKWDGLLWDELLVLMNCYKVIFDIFNMTKNGDEVEVYVSHGACNPNNQPPSYTFPSNPNTHFDDPPSIVPHPSIVPPSSYVP
ncbi:hypothetical protein H5410_003007 [Solanum commersonii]|uniref:PB1-like domain-containing protein n=1 Tax=Solanum commersonii TaxID=4109 RepID=A0A9J6B3X3_SOLCO|nr:hypothetical protein H5410_003007 [Solanum commersonii]